MIKKRGVKTLTGLSAHFRRCDRTGDGMLDRYELQAALNDYHINLTPEVFIHRTRKSLVHKCNMCVKRKSCIRISEFLEATAFGNF